MDSEDSVDSGGFRWIQADSGGFKWIQVCGFMYSFEPNTFAEICGCPKYLSDITILTNGFEQANLRAQLRAFGNF